MTTTSSVTPDHLALAALADALRAAPEQLPLTPPDRAALQAALDDPRLQEAKALVLPPGGGAANGANPIAVFSKLWRPAGAPLLDAIPLPAGALSLHLTAGENATPVAGPESLAADLTTLSGRPLLAPRALADLLLGLLQRHAWSTPNGTGRYLEIPLADYARQHAALAACLGTTDLDPAAPFALVGVDMSGIQAFIYDIASRKAARALKGRSFYLHLLADNFVAAVLDTLGLSRAHIVYASGGGAYLLAPNTEGLADTLKTLRHDLSERLFTEAGTRLFLALDYVPLTADDLHDEPLKKVWGALSDKLSAQKRRRFAEKLVTQQTLFFTPTEQGGEEPQDAVTGDELRAADRDPATNDWLDFNSEEGDEPGSGLKISRFTQQHIQLGSTLARAEGIDTAEGATRKPERFDVFEPGSLPYWNVLPDKPNALTEKPAYARAPGVRADLLNEPDFLNRAGATGFQFYGGNDYPRDEKNQDAPKTYDHLAGDATSGFRRLGVLRMDVDSLGKQFIKGFHDGSVRSLAHYVTLSRALDWFFKGYLNTLWRSDEQYRSNLSIVYSGGDDLFVVGRWDAAIDFGAAIAEKFRAYTGGALTLSGGVAIVPPRFPISRAARLAEDEEKLAKSHRVGNDGPEKNAFSFLGTAVNWQMEWPVVQDLHTRLVGLMGSGQLPRSVLRRIYEFNEQDRAGSLKWRWQMAYDFSRLRERLRDDDAKRWIELIERAAITNDYPLPGPPGILAKHARFLDLLTLAARWAELTLRSDTKA